MYDQYTRASGSFVLHIILHDGAKPFCRPPNCHRCAVIHRDMTYSDAWWRWWHAVAFGKEGEKKTKDKRTHIVVYILHAKVNRDDGGVCCA